jgi:thiosulfate/3-mercaptopyruvate sulfurtransferase
MGTDKRYLLPVSVHLRHYPSERDNQTAVEDASFASPTVSAAWLAEHLESVVIADVRWSMADGPKEADYRRGHIPGAVFVDLDHDLADPSTPTGGRHPLPHPERFARRLGALGIGDRTPVVAYDDACGSVAARLWWLLHTLGAPVAVLDGGLQAWEGPLSQAEPDIHPVTRTARPWPSTRFVDADGIASFVGGLLLDARSATRYARGDPAIDPRPGHIPNARNAPWTENLDGATGQFLPRVDLRRSFSNLGAEPTTRVIAYCGSGVTACHDLLALDLAGMHDTALFPGSWSAWGADPQRPAVSGSD